MTLYDDHAQHQYNQDISTISTHTGCTHQEAIDQVYKIADSCTWTHHQVAHEVAAFAMVTGVLPASFNAVWSFSVGREIAARMVREERALLSAKQLDRFSQVWGVGGVSSD